MKNNSFLKVIYTFLIGIFLAVFVGVGIAAFYPEQRYPEPPVAVKYGSPDAVKDFQQTEEGMCISNFPNASMAAR